MCTLRKGGTNSPWAPRNDLWSLLTQNSRGTDMVLWGLEDILGIIRLQWSFCGAHCSTKPPPSYTWLDKAIWLRDTFTYTPSIGLNSLKLSYIILMRLFNPIPTYVWFIQNRLQGVSWWPSLWYKSKHLIHFW